jgi:dihydroflavonol-4-reductase
MGRIAYTFISHSGKNIVKENCTGAFMKTFITGGTSSIGRVLIKELSGQGVQLCVLVRKSSNVEGLSLPNVEFVYGDVTDERSVREGMAGCEQVIHMAAVVGGNLPEEEWWRVNRDGTGIVLRAAELQKVASMVQVSSLSVLGNTEPGEVADETRPIDPGRHTNLYQKTKFAADEMAREFAAKGLPVKIVYPGFGFGCSFASSHPSMQDQTLLRMAAGKPCAIMGDGKNKLLAAYYNDTVEGIRLAHLHGKAGEGYILGNEDVTFPEIWQVVAQVLGKQVPTRKIPLKFLKGLSAFSESVFHKRIFPQDFFDMVGLNWNFSNRKAVEKLGWQPLTFANAMQKTWEAYLSSGKLPM